MKIFMFVTLWYVGVSLGAQAASFQYIFNNVEQGPNSNTSPSIVVDGEKIKKSEPNPPTAIQAPESHSSTQNIAQTPEEGENLKLRLMAMGNRVSQGLTGDWSHTKSEMKTLAQGGQSNTTLSLAGSVFVQKDIALTGFWLPGRNSQRSHLGGEMEFIPVRMAVLGKENLIELGFMLGASTLGREEAVRTGTIHAGARLNVNFHKHLGITSALRTNVSERSTYHYSMAEAGLAYNF